MRVLGWIDTLNILRPFFGHGVGLGQRVTTPVGVPEQVTSVHPPNKLNIELLHIKA
jgi:hypothetical protein